MDEKIADTNIFIKIFRGDADLKKQVESLRKISKPKEFGTEKICMSEKTTVIGKNMTAAEAEAAVLIREELPPAINSSKKRL